jgi:hypothetical protein
MQNAFNITKTMLVQPSLRPEIEIHGLNYDFPKTQAQPFVKSGDAATRNTVVPGKPTATQGTSSPQSATTSPLYKTVSPPAAHISKPGEIANEKIATLSTKPTFRCTAKTFADAVQSGCLKSVVRHIKAGLDVNVGPKLYAEAPLMIAVWKDNEAIVRRLLEAGAYVNQAREDGVTALMHAAQVGRTGSVLALLEQGAIVDQTTINGTTALLYAAANNKIASVQALLDRGAAIDHANSHGKTALIYAAKFGSIAMVQALLDRGANCKLANEYGDTALRFAIAGNHDEIVKLLRAHEALTNS